MFNLPYIPLLNSLSKYSVLHLGRELRNGLYVLTTLYDFLYFYMLNLFCIFFSSSRSTFFHFFYLWYGMLCLFYVLPFVCSYLCMLFFLYDFA